MKELIKAGFWVFFFEGPPLGAFAWGSILVGFLLQYLLLKKVKQPYIRRIFPMLLLIGIVACEYLTRVTTGWDLFGILLVYGMVLCCALGAGAAWAVRGIQKWRGNGAPQTKVTP